MTHSLFPPSSDPPRTRAGVDRLGRVGRRDRPNPRRWYGRAAAAVLVLALAVGCGPDIPGSTGGATIETETFMQAMVDLRSQAADRPGGELPPVEAERILDTHGVDTEDLRRFVEVHGENVPFMNSVWAEVDRRLDEPPDSMDTGP